MERLNYFNPYRRKDGGHEDQLTRAYLVLLKYSHQAFVAFYSYCLEQYGKSGSLDEEGKLPFYHHLLSSDINIDTQRKSLTFQTQKLLSVVISDKQLGYKDTKIQRHQRTARYDGIVEIGEELTIVIENKPRVENVWMDQLKPSESNFTEDKIDILSVAASLEWKEIIKQLNSILSSPESISREEKLLIEDFLSYVDDEFTVLNPYDSFDLCKDNETLIQRRIKNVLKDIAGEEFDVRKQITWGFEIELGYPEIRMAGLLLNEEESDWYLTLALYFGLGVKQGRNFYNHEIDLSEVKQDFVIQTHFKFSYIRQGIIDAFPSTDVDRYIEYWKNNKEDISQIKRDEVNSYLQKLSNAGVIKLTKEKEKELTENFWNTNRPELNPNPAIGLLYNINSNKAKELDKKGEFEAHIKDKLYKALSIIGREPEQFKN